MTQAGKPFTRPVFPGEIITEVKSVKGVTVLGPGLKRNENKINSARITCPGILHFKPPNVYWIEHDHKRYIPKRGDLVVGIVTKKAGDTLRIDVGASEFASLSMLAFEGATKKQKPDVQVGDIIYGKLLNAHKEMEPEMVCVDSYFKAGKLGILQGGCLMVTSINLVNRILEAENHILEALGKMFPYEIAVGMNGKVWINAKTEKDILLIVRCLEMAETNADRVVIEFCKRNK